MMAIAGCSEPASHEPPRLVPVVGTLTYKGSLVPGARLAFHPPDSNDVADVPFGETDSQGRFSLVMQDFGPGAAPGEYLVTVLHPTDNLPGRYEAKDSTTLRATVEDKETNDIPLSLED